MIQSDCISDSCINHERRIINKIKCCDNIQLFKVSSKPIGKFVSGLVR